MGLFLGLSTFMSTVVCLPLIWILAGQRGHLSSGQYLGFRSVSYRTTAHWVILTVVFTTAADLFTHFAIHLPVIPDFVIDTYTTAGFRPLFVIALVVCAPLFEEFLFRGLLFEGFRHSRLGTGGAILFTSLAWSVIHLQYDLYGVFVVFLGGLLLGGARARTGSLFVSILMHSVWNFIAVVEVSVHVSR
jgi:membrane protease YdiL (CAAX protease family)